MVLTKRIQLPRLQLVLFRLLLILLLLAGWAGSAHALSLLQVRSTSMTEGELFTLTFDQDLSLRVTTSSGQTMRLEATSPLFNDAVLPSSQLLTGIDVSQNTLSLTYKVPVSASLRRAGAGTWLLMVQPTGEPAQPQQRETRTQSQPQTRSQTPQPVAAEPESEQGDLSDQLSDADLLMLAQLYKLQDRNEQAKEVVNQIPENADSYPWGRLLMGNIKEDEGDDRGAKQEYEKALKYSQTMSAAATSLALMHQRKGEKEAAEAMWEMVLRSDDASVPPYAQGQGQAGSADAGDRAFVRNASNAQPRAEASGITFDGNSAPMEFFDTRLLLIIVVTLIVTGGIAGGLLLHRTRRKVKEPPPDDSRDEAVFWGDENDDVAGDGAGALEAELAGEKPNGDRPKKTREMKISEETRKMVVDMHNSGNSVREIAEITGKSQDEIRMALQMEGVPAEP